MARDEDEEEDEESEEEQKPSSDSRAPAHIIALANQEPVPDKPRVPIVIKNKGGRPRKHPLKLQLA